MLRTILRRSAVLCAALLLSTMATAQVVPVNNTGCPGYAPPQVFGNPRLGQQVAFALQRLPAPRSQVFLAMGFPSGGGIPFQAPVTCVAGPCVFYPAPIGSDLIFVADVFRVDITLNIPNDPALLFQTFAVQGGNLDGLFGTCFTLTQALSFAIQP
jgi:hypothetical protein